jgi:hypothetical protein
MLPSDMGREKFKGIRACVSLPTEVIARAAERMKKQGEKKFSAYITGLIARDKRKRH